LQVKLQGTVRLEVLVERDGKVAKVRVIRSLDRQFGLDDEAVAAAEKWRFAPATKDGRPVRIVVSIDVSFTLR
jgi:TonB family protein